MDKEAKQIVQGHTLVRANLNPVLFDWLGKHSLITINIEIGEPSETLKQIPPLEYIMQCSDIGFCYVTHEKI